MVFSRHSLIFSRMDCLIQTCLNLIHKNVVIDSVILVKTTGTISFANIEMN